MSNGTIKNDLQAFKMTQEKFGESLKARAPLVSELRASLFLTFEEQRALRERLTQTGRDQETLYPEQLGVNALQVSLGATYRNSGPYGDVCFVLKQSYWDNDTGFATNTSTLTFDPTFDPYKQPFQDFLVECFPMTLTLVCRRLKDAVLEEQDRLAALPYVQAMEKLI